MSGPDIRSSFGTIRSTLKSSLLGFLIGILTFLILYVSGIRLPSIEHINAQFLYGIRTWTNLARIDSPIDYTLSAVILVTPTIALISSYNRDSPSPTISGILKSPGVFIWVKYLADRLERKYWGYALSIGGGVARFYLWVLSIIAYFLYPAHHLINSDTSVFVVSSSVLLASVSFGTIFGRFDRGLVLSLKECVNEANNSDFLEQKGSYPKFWALIMPISVVLSIYITKIGVTSLDDTSFGQVFAASSSVFLSTFLPLVAIFYFIGILLVIVPKLFDALSEYRNDDLTFREALNIQRSLDNTEKEHEQRANTSEYGYPDDIAESLREYYKR